ncbi:uncharacterized protein LOC126336339 [Schistocerca gregaria]|uniref:uncharacterized protein LOC126336339 n=1 Tax=Schistocerca gregaria TaxID=7010 RepID=UPI00211E4EE3|nr:uncharacterized protein LOC126336339 [Schistocerca gregaria]
MYERRSCLRCRVVSNLQHVGWTSTQWSCLPMLLCLAVRTTRVLRKLTTRSDLHLWKPESMCKNEPIRFLQRKYYALQNQQLSTNMSEKAPHATYQVALRVEKNGKLQTIAEELILPSATELLWYLS